MENFFDKSNEKHASIGLCESEVNIVINGMDLILTHDEVFISEEETQWYTHIKNLFESFRQWNY
jgi:hypothetical protein